MLKAIKQRHAELVDLEPFNGDLATIRIACLLHDCGHGFGSHASEEIYKWHPAILRAKQTADKFIDAKASEVLSCYIVTSPAFRAFLSEINTRCGTTLDADRIENLILGIPWDQRSFLGEVLNGPFDVDRIDYIVRDTEYSGVKAAIDLERFFHDVDVSLLKDGKIHLVLRSTHAIEQLLWTKVHLFNRLYRHQKTLAADAAVQSIVPVVKATGRPFHGADFQRVSDFLRVTDMDILGADIAALAPSLATLLENIRFRRLPQRALALTLAALKSAGTPAQRMLKLISLNETQDGLPNLRKEIHEAIPSAQRPPLESILVVLPKPPPLREASQTYVVLRGRDPITLNDLFRIDEWLTTYNDQHWAGYVFSNASDVEVVCNAAIEVFAKRGVEVDTILATSARKPAVPCPAPVPKQIASEDSIVEVVPRLPVLEAFVQRRLAEAQNAFKDLRVVFILHFLSDLSPLLERFEKLGMNPRNTWLVRKPYAYPSVAQITAKLRDKGYVIHDCTAAEGTEGPARRALLELRDKLSGAEQFVVVEDGGYITPMLHTAEFASLRERCIGVVEQTTKGIRSIKVVAENPGLKLPVISVAESQLKLSIEASEVGDALAVTLESYFRRFRGVPLNRLPTLVVGFGAVGRNLALALAMRGAKVTIYDLEPAARYEALASKVGSFDVLESLDDLSPFRLIVGTTGKTSLDIATILKCADGAILASGSSDRLEFDVGKLREHVAQPIDKNIIVDKWSTRYQLNNGRTIEVLCDGYPINFILGDGIAKAVIDPILTELLAGALILAQNQQTNPGIHPLPKELEKELWQLYRSLSGL
jgi:S-adenosylhomocysteine hydrolase/HD superfamily phosphohydrolase